MTNKYQQSRQEARNLGFTVPENCNCPAMTWAEYAKGPRGENYPACQACGRAICPRNYDGSRYFAARMERRCECATPVFPQKVSHHAVWCASQATTTSHGLAHP